MAAGGARTVLATLAGLLVWSVLPVVLGWQPTVVLSGSMEPAISAGDVVVTREVPADALRPGQVLWVADPAASGRQLMHRYDHMGDAGELVLKGDANDEVDSTPVFDEDVQGVGVLRIPWVGVPYVWFSEGRYLAVLAALGGLVALLLLSPVRELDAEDDDVPEDASPPPTGGGDRRAATVAAATLTVMLVATGPSPPASASFSATTGTSATFTAGNFAESAAAPPPSAD